MTDLKVLADNGTPSHSYGTPLAIWDHLPPDTSERALPNPSHATPEGWKAELTYLT